MSEHTGSTAVAGDFMHALAKRDWDRIEKLCTPDYVHHAPRVAAADVHAYIQTAQRMFTAFPDMTATIEELVGTGEWATVRYVTRGTHRAPFAGIPATGRPVSFSALGLIHVRDGKLTEGWFEFDTGAIIEQLASATACGVTGSGVRALATGPPLPASGESGGLAGDLWRRLASSP